MMQIKEPKLVGTWRSASADSRRGTNAYGDVTLKFGSDGTLLYIIHDKDRDQIIRLTYRTEPGFIITDQPSEPRTEKTEYRIGEDGILVLAFGGQVSRYIKVQ